MPANPEPGQRLGNGMRRHIHRSGQRRGGQRVEHPDRSGYGDRCRLGQPKLFAERVVDVARSLAGQGDTVLLAPAGASFDRFSSYGQRGDAFASAVSALTQ